VSHWHKQTVTTVNPVEGSKDFDREMTMTINCLPGYPAQTYGDPEDCYPGAGPEFEILEAKYDDGREVPQDILDAFDDNAILDLLEVYSDYS